MNEGLRKEHEEKYRELKRRIRKNDKVYVLAVKQDAASPVLTDTALIRIVDGIPYQFWSNIVSKDYRGEPVRKMLKSIEEETKGGIIIAHNAEKVRLELGHEYYKEGMKMPWKKGEFFCSRLIFQFMTGHLSPASEHTVEELAEYTMIPVVSEGMLEAMDEAKTIAAACIRIAELGFEQLRDLWEIRQAEKGITAIYNKKRPMWRVIQRELIRYLTNLRNAISMGLGALITEGVRALLRWLTGS